MIAWGRRYCPCGKKEVSWWCPFLQFSLVLNTVLYCFLQSVSLHLSLLQVRVEGKSKKNNCFHTAVVKKCNNVMKKKKQTCKLVYSNFQNLNYQGQACSIVCRLMMQFSDLK